MTNPVNGEVTVKVEAGEFTLAFTLGACAAIEGEFDGRSLSAILDDIQGEEPKVATVLVVLWAALRKHHKLSRDEVGDLVNISELPLWGEAIGKAFAGAQPEAKEKHPTKAAPAN
jgi:hypothetical protein